MPLTSGSRLPLQRKSSHLAGAFMSTSRSAATSAGAKCAPDPQPYHPQVTLTGASTVVLRMGVACDIVSVGRESAGCVCSS